MYIVAYVCHLLLIYAFIPFCVHTCVMFMPLASTSLLLVCMCGCLMHDGMWHVSQFALGAKCTRGPAPFVGYVSVYTVQVSICWLFIVHTAATPSNRHTPSPSTAAARRPRVQLLAPDWRSICMCLREPVTLLPSHTS